MNNILKLSVLSLAAVCVMSCVDDRNNFMVDDGVLISTAGYENNVATVSVYDGAISLKVHKSGKGVEAGEMTVAMAPEILADYNEEKHTNYVALSSEYVSLSGESFSFREEETTKQLLVTWDPQVVAPAIKAGEEKTTVIPIKITGSNLSIWEGTDYLLVKLVKPVVNMASESFSRTASFDMKFVDIQKISVKVDEQLQEDANVVFEFDPSLVDEYNKANGTDYKAAPAKLVQLPMKAVIPAGATNVTADVAILSEEFYAAFGDEGMSTLLAPIRIKVATSNNLPMAIGSNDVIYITVSGPEYPVPSFEEKNMTWSIFQNKAVETLSSTINLSTSLSGITSYAVLSIDNSLIDSYNAAHGTNYVAAVDGLITLPAQVEIPADTKVANFNFKLNRGKYSDMASLDNGVLVPIRMTGLSINGAAQSVEGDEVLYLTLAKPEYREIMGNASWVLLEGEQLSTGWDPSGETASAWYREQYSSKGLCDGEFGPNVFDGPGGTVWGSWFTNPMEFPLDFVFDMKEPHSFSVIWKYEWFNGQGSFNHLIISLSDDYKGADTDWNLVYDGNIGPAGWEIAGGAKHSDDAQNKDVVGRYLRIRLPECTNSAANQGSNCYGFIREIWFEGY